MPKGRTGQPRDLLLEPPWLTVLSDRPLRKGDASADSFDLARRVGPIYDILRHPKTQTPMTIAIYGDWGAGKTSAMKWLEGRLNDWNARGKGTNKVTVRTVWFYPWKYQAKEDVWRGLIAEVIVECLNVKKADDDAFLSTLRDLGGFLGTSFIDLLSGLKLSAGLPGAAKATLDLKTLKEIKQNAKEFVRPESAYLNQFENALEGWIAKTLDKDERMVVFIDDLDRCLPGVALQVLEALKLYLNIDKLIFVVGVDREVVDDLVKKHYEDLGVRPGKAANYLAKIFQVEVTVGPSDPQIDAFLEAALADNAAWGEIDETAREILGAVIRSLAAASPREIKRLINSALMAGAGARMSTLEVDPEKEITPVEGIQVFLVRTVLETRHTLGSLVGRDRGTAFFTAWSEIVRQTVDTPTLPVPAEFAEAVRRRYGAGAARDVLDKGDDDTVTRQFEQWLEGIPTPYKEIVTKPEYADLLHLLADQDLGELMRLPYPREAVAIGGTAVDTTSAGLIREAVARQLDVELSELTAGDYGRVTELDFRGQEITDLEALKGLANLTTLNLHGTQVADLEPLKGLANLEWLDLEGTQVSELEPLKGLANLKRLYLRGTPVADLEPLKGLANVQSLGLSGTQVSDLKPLRRLKNLAFLSLEHTQVVDLESLKGLERLKDLYLEGTPISDDEVAALQAALPDLDIDR